MPLSKMEDNMADASRPQMFLFGELVYNVLCFLQVCLGADVEDKFHMVEVEGLTFDGKTTTVPLAALKPSVLPSVSLGGFEITPPVTFRLQSGSGPVYISGQHFVGRFSYSVVFLFLVVLCLSVMPYQCGFIDTNIQYILKKLKMDSDEDDSDEEDDDDE
uniref:Nucleophosmin n=1 Tax=Periophthalmus magnuspinnatus TaxID=409849 RepID=A0A3B3ZZN4_9GOBI